MELWDSIKRWLGKSDKRENEISVISEQEPSDLVHAKKMLARADLDEIYQLSKRKLIYWFTERSPENCYFGSSMYLAIDKNNMQRKYWYGYQEDLREIEKRFELIIPNLKKVLEYSNCLETRVKLTKAERMLDELRINAYLMQRVTDRFISQNSKYISPKDPNSITERDLEKLAKFCNSLEPGHIKTKALKKIVEVREKLSIPESKELYEMIINCYKERGDNQTADYLRNKYKINEPKSEQIAMVNLRVSR